MIEVTERQLAEKRINNIKEELKNSQVDYHLNETPYSLSIVMKKKFLKDFSSKSSTTTTSTPLRCLNSFSESSMPTESGIDLTCSKCDSCEELAKQVDKTRKECVQNILESKETIKDLEAEDLKKAALIKQLNFELKTAKEENTKVKKELGVRNDQLKDKNKSVEKLKLSIDKIKSESENMQSNLNHKIDNLEKVNKNLHSKLHMKETK